MWRRFRSTCRCTRSPPAAHPAAWCWDPFSGAATTGLAALHLGRSYIGVDICAAFHDEALARLRPHLPGPGPGGGGG